MKLEQFESEERRTGSRPWRKDAPPLNKPPTNPNYPTKKFDYNEWMKSSKKMEEDSSEMPEVGDAIRTKKMQMEGKVERIGQNRAGYDEVFFRIEDGRLMKTPMDNVIVIQKLADEDHDIFEERTDELSTELLAKYKTAAGKDARQSDKDGDTARGNKRFGGIIKATNKQFDNDKKKHVKEDPNTGQDSNFTAADIKRLEGIRDLPTIQAQAKELVKGKAAKRIKPDKLEYFYKQVDTARNTMEVIRLMYNLLLAGEGQGVIGSRNSMKSNAYRSKFGEGSMGGINRVPQLGLSHEHDLEPKSYEEKLEEFLSVDEVYQGPHVGDPTKLAKAPKSSMQGSKEFTFSQKVQDTINTHGVKWAFDYYVKKHGLPPRQFKIFAGL